MYMNWCLLVFLWTKSPFLFLFLSLFADRCLPIFRGLQNFDLESMIFRFSNHTNLILTFNRVCWWQTSKIQSNFYTTMNTMNSTLDHNWQCRHILQPRADQKWFNQKNAIWSMYSITDINTCVTWYKIYYIYWMMIGSYICPIKKNTHTYTRSLYTDCYR